MKFYLPYIAIALVVMALMVDGGSRLAQRSPRTAPAKTVRVFKRSTPARTQHWMLKQGVATAWVGHLGPAGKADCFSTQIVQGRHIFSYCKLRKPGLVP